MRQNYFEDFLITLVITALQQFERAVPDLDSGFAPAAESREFLIAGTSDHDLVAAAGIIGAPPLSREPLIHFDMGKNPKYSWKFNG